MKIYPLPQEGGRPPLLHAPYAATVRRAPSMPPIPLPPTLSELTGPLYGHNPIGERIVVAGRALDEDGRPIPSRTARAHAGGTA